MTWPLVRPAVRAVARAARPLLWGLALAAVLTVGAAPPSLAAPEPSRSAAVAAGPAPAAQAPGAGTAGDPCALDSAARTGEWDCLPFYRWAAEADSFYTNFGRSDAKAIVMQPVVSLLFGIAGLMWRLLQWLTRTALGFDLFNTAQAGQSTPIPLQPIDDGFAAIARVVLSGLGMTVLVIAVIVVLVRAGRDGETRLRDLLRPFVCLGVLLFLLSRAVPPPGGGAQVGSPAWVAQRGVGMSNVVGDQISSVAPQRADQQPPGNLLDCYHYVRQLRASFDRRDDFDGDLVGGVAFQPQLASHMSSLWEAAYLDLWIEAQFGRDETLGRRAYCRMLEDRANVAPSDQAALTLAAAAEAGAALPAPGLAGTAPFGGFNDGRDFRRGMIAWAVCGWYEDRGGLHEEVDGRLVSVSGPGFAVNPEMRLMWNLGSPPSERRDGTCAAWWGVDGSGTTKPPPRGSKCCLLDGDGPFNFGDQGDIDEAFTVFGEDELAEVTGTGTVAPYTDEDRAGLRAGREWVLSLNGHNLIESVPNAILAIVIAAVYLWAVGGLALGTLVAQFLVILFFVSLPLLLVVGMWPTVGAGLLFWRSVKTGAGSLFAKAAFVALLSVLMTLISIINRLGEVTGAFDTSGGGGVDAAGFGGVMLQAAAPVVAIWALRWMVKDLGMGNIFSLQGAMGLTGRLARGSEAHGDRSVVASWARGRWERGRNTRYQERRSRTVDRRSARRRSRRHRLRSWRSGGRGGDGGHAGDGGSSGPGGRAKRLLKGRAAALAAGGAVLAAPLGSAAFVSAPIVGGVALAGWAARRADRNRVGTAEVPPGHGRGPVAAEVADGGPGRVADAYGAHVEAVVAAGNVADPAGAAHHPDLRAIPDSAVTRGVGGDGRVYGQGSSGLYVPATAGWDVGDGEPFSAPRGYRGGPPGPVAPGDATPPAGAGTAGPVVPSTRRRSSPRQPPARRSP